MELLLNKKVESIPIFKTLVTLLQGMNDLSGINSIEDIYAVNKMSDPVREFINYYLIASNQVMTNDQIDYIANALYMSKGAPRIFEVLSELFFINIRYDYSFPKLNIVEFNKIKVSDVELFLDKFESMLYYLLYYTEITLGIRYVILSLQGELRQVNSGLILGYSHYKYDQLTYELNN